MAELVAVALDPTNGVALATADGHVERIGPLELTQRLDTLDREGVRWVWWNGDTARSLATLGIRPKRCWDLGAVHRLLVGGWRSGPAEVWAHVHDLDPASIPTAQPVDLFSHARDDGDPHEPVGLDRHLRPDWVNGSWADSPDHLGRWASLAIEVQRHQTELLGARAATSGAGPVDHLRTTAFAESAIEIVCAELERDGLPFDRRVGEDIIASFVGPRPTGAAGERRQLDALDRTVLQHLPGDARIDLRSPDQVRSLLRRVGIEVPDTRAWRLEALGDAHPVVPALLQWRRAERMRTTFGYEWIDAHVGDDGRLRGAWHGSDGSAGRMTATAGLHNMPAEMRPAVAAGDGYRFVRSDLGQIEPRVLAAVSGDARLAAATHEADMYAPVASRLGVDRDIAKVAVLGAMYGQTTGKGAEALRGLEREYPVAMGHLRLADEAAQGGRDLITYGGRRVPMSANDEFGVSSDALRSRAAARGRYGRNAIVQGAAAELFKTWAVLVRMRTAAHGASVVLCLHDELVVHTPTGAAAAVAESLDTALQEAASRWAPAADVPVRFVSDTSVVERWSDAK